MVRKLITLFIIEVTAGEQEQEADGSPGVFLSFVLLPYQRT